MAIPCNPQAKLTSVKSAVESGELTPRMVERLLCEGEAPQRFAKALISGGWRAAAGCDDAEAVDAVAQAVKGRTRILNSLLKDR